MTTLFTDRATTISASWLNSVDAIITDPAITAIAGVTPAADRLPYFTGAAAASVATFTNTGRSLVGQANVDDTRAVISLGAAGAFIVRSDGHSGFGYTGAPEVFTANRRYISIAGSGTATGDGAGVIQFRSNSPEGQNVVGVTEFIDPNNTSGNKRVGYIAMTLAAGTPNNRGAYMTFATRPDAGSVAVEAMRISSTGAIAIGSTVTGSGDRFRLGDGTSSSIMRLLGSSGANGQAQLKLTRDSVSTWSIVYGGAANTNLTFALGASDDTEAAIATAAQFTIDGFGLASFGSHAPNTAKLLVSVATTTPSTPIANSIAWFVGANSTSPILGIEAIAGNGELHLRRADGTMAAKTGVVASDVLGRLMFAGYTSAAAFGTGSAAVQSAASETWSGTAQGANLQFHTTKSTTTTLTERMRIHNNGFVSIGNSPSYTNGGTRCLLTVTAGTAGTIDPPASTVAQFASIDGGTGTTICLDSYGGAPLIFFRRCDTSIAAPTAPQLDEVLGGFGSRPYDGTAWQTASRATVNQVAAENWSSTNLGTYLSFSTTLSGTTTTSQKMRLLSHGGLVVCSGTMPTPGTSTLLAVSNNSAAMTPPSNLAYFAAADGTTTTLAADSAAAAGTILFRRANTTLAAPSALANNDNIASVSGRGYGATAYSGGPRVNMSFYAAEAWTDTAQGTYITFSTTAATTTTLTEQLRIGPDGALTIANKITSYNGVATVGNGVAALVAKSLLTAQTAAIAATTIYAVPASGQGVYRVSFVASITTVATSSSGLGGLATTGFKVIFTNPNDSVVKTSVTNSQNNHVSTTTNLTTTTVSGTYLAYCKASTNLQYSFDYASVNAAEMNYDLQIFVEYLGA